MIYRNGIHILVAAFACISCSPVQNEDRYSHTDEIELPSRIDQYRFFVTPVTLQGDTLQFLVDTGGNSVHLYDHVVSALGLEQFEYAGERSGPFTHSLPVVRLPNFQQGLSIPSPKGTEGHLYVLPYGKLADPLRSEDGSGKRMMDTWSGLLGSPWFSERTWTFDYARGNVVLRPDGTLPPHADRHRIPLHFKTDAQGHRENAYSIMQAVVAGDTLDLLFDTGATTIFGDSVLTLLNDGRPAIRESSFIRESIYVEWHSRHSSWRTFPRGAFGGLSHLIEVPILEVGGHQVGPVWFATQPDVHFASEHFPRRHLDGALGGSAFKHFSQVTADYVNGALVFPSPHRLADAE